MISYLIILDQGTIQAAVIFYGIACAVYFLKVGKIFKRSQAGNGISFNLKAGQIC